MKTAVHYAMTAEGDEVWLILTPQEHAEVADCLELAVQGRLVKATGVAIEDLDIIAVLSRTALRAAARYVAEKVVRSGGHAGSPDTLGYLHNVLRYQADRLRRADVTPESVFVEEARAGLPAGQEA